MIKNPSLNQFISALHTDDIPLNRRLLIEKLGSKLAELLLLQETLILNFICTHNSRRSQIAQAWAYAISKYLGLSKVQSASAGTEATAFYPNAVKSLQKAGFTINAERNGSNPFYRLKVDDEDEGILCFSKAYDHPSLIERPFVAIMVCSDAEENCPFIPQAKLRFPLSYQDPKISDGTNQMEEVYDGCSLEIAREIFFLLSLLPKSS